MFKYDAVVLTDSRYVAPVNIDRYVQNVLDEDNLVMRALERRGLKVWRTNWDNPDFDWSATKFVIFRSTWDYFERFPEFSAWLDRVSTMTSMVNQYEIIKWNMDKHYLGDLEQKGINITPTLFIEPGDQRSLNEIIEETRWSEIILKPAVSGASRHTYRLHPDNIKDHKRVFRELIAIESMLLQEFQHNIIEKGEVALMVFGGKYSHAVLKKAKAGDFRVQDDFGGSVHDYHASAVEIEFAEKVVSVCDPLPVYARVDVIRDNKNELCVSELELIEPELWLRKYPRAADLFVDSLIDLIA